MAADFQEIFVGVLDITAVGRSIDFDAGPWTTGTFQYRAPSGATIGAWSCSIKRAIGSGAPIAFPTAMAFTSAAIVQPATVAQDLTATKRVTFTTDTVGTGGIVEIWACVKASVPLN